MNLDLALTLRNRREVFERICKSFAQEKVRKERSYFEDLNSSKFCHFDIKKRPEVRASLFTEISSVAARQPKKYSEFSLLIVYYLLLLSSRDRLLSHLPIVAFHPQMEVMQHLEK